MYDIALGPTTDFFGEKFDEKLNPIIIDEDDVYTTQTFMLNKNIIKRLEKNIKNFTWPKCLEYRVKESREKFCGTLFTSQYDIRNCKNRFCLTCCSKFVDITNKVKRNLCEQQCRLMETDNTTDKAWKQCAYPTIPSRSAYKYCDEISYGYYNNKMCKVDMCNLCCSKYEGISKINISQKNLESCYKTCDKSKVIC